MSENSTTRTLRSEYTGRTKSRIEGGNDTGRRSFVIATAMGCAGLAGCTDSDDTDGNNTTELPAEVNWTGSTPDEFTISDSGGRYDGSTVGVEVTVDNGTDEEHTVGVQEIHLRNDQGSRITIVTADSRVDVPRNDSATVEAEAEPTMDVSEEEVASVTVFLNFNPITL